jgi:uncharacterized protein (DUF1810 family)
MTNNNETSKQSQDFELIRFVNAQENIYPQVIAELRNGRKQSHWMWFIFPQIDGLGTSPTAKRYSIKSAEEAIAYLNHPLLGKRLLECFAILMEIQGKTAEEIFGYPDYLKLQSSVTLFSIVNPQEEIFAQVLEKYYKNKKDQRTIDLLNK